MPKMAERSFAESILVEGTGHRLEVARARQHFQLPSKGLAHEIFGSTLKRSSTLIVLKRQRVGLTGTYHLFLTGQVGNKNMRAHELQ